MTETNPTQLDGFLLPASIVTRIDVSRIVSEVERIDNELISREARGKAGTSQNNEIVLSEQLSDFLSVNKIEITADGVQRSNLISKLRQFKATVPSVHITFATSADTESLQEIVRWLRRSVNPQAVIKVGLQPSLIGGAYVRTTNHVHDFSLRSKLAGHRDIITKEVEALRGGN